MLYSMSMTAVPLEEFQRDLKGYLERVHAGETLIVLEADQPLVEIKPVAAETPKPRPFGLCAGEFTVPEDFNEPLSEEVISSFEDR
jgi:antitoxin (DNA-binding transcriptional repressor) of toxin-antitoxin stability system